MSAKLLRALCSNQLRWNQLNELEDPQHSLRSLFGRLLKNHSSRATTCDVPRKSEDHSFQTCLFQQPVGRPQVHWPEGQENVAHWIPLVDISEDPKEYLIKIELPQVKKRDVKLTMEGSTLTITGDRKFKKNSKKNHRVEHTHGSFVHSFSLPDDATHPEVTAEFNDGVLKVHLAKNEKASPQQVEVAAIPCPKRTGITLPMP